MADLESRKRARRRLQAVKKAAIATFAAANVVACGAQAYLTSKQPGIEFNELMTSETLLDKANYTGKPIGADGEGVEAAAALAETAVFGIGMLVGKVAETAIKQASAPGQAVSTPTASAVSSPDASITTPSVAPQQHVSVHPHKITYSGQRNQHVKRALSPGFK